jgi:hypothetical protein
MKPKETQIQDVLKVEGVNAKGYGIIPKLLMLDNRITLAAKSVYAYFCSYAGAGGTAFPCREKILSDLSISKDTYYKYLNQLKELDYVRTNQVTAEGCKYGRTVFTLVAKPNVPEKSESGTSDNDYEIILKNEGVKSRGYGTIPKLVMTDTRLNIISKGIYSYFCSFSGSGNTSFPKLESILYNLGISNATYFKHVKSLRELGYISAEQLRQKGQFKKTIYTLNEFPVESASEKPCPKLSCTVTSYTAESYTVKQDTKSNNLKSNNSYKYQSFNKKNRSQPIIMNDEQEKKLTSIFTAMGIEKMTHTDQIDAMKNIILNLWITRRVNKATITQKTIEDTLTQLHSEHLDAIIDNYCAAAQKNVIHNPVEYLKTAVMNSITTVKFNNLVKKSCENKEDPSYDIDEYIKLSMRTMNARK